MQESERRQRIAGAPRMNPEEVAGRAFSTSRRGYSEQEVRSFLRRVADELGAGRERERELLDTLDELENRLRAPRPLDEKELLDALGEETARLLRSAKEAADDIRGKAEDRVARLLEESQNDVRRLREETQEESRRLREEAEQLLARRAEEAEAAATATLKEAEERAGAVRAEADRYAEEQGERARTESEAAIEAARSQGREMLEEAKAVRERVLGDMTRRRNVLQTQLEDLRAGRDALIDAYRVVKRTFLEATEALAQAETRAAERRAAAPEALAAATAAADAASPEAGDEGEESEEHEEARPAALADVDSLFARLRAGTHPAGEVDEEAAGERPDSAALQEEGPPEPAGEAEASGADAGAAERASAEGTEQWRETRDRDVAPAAVTVLKSAKRTAQDEQNAVLDAVRRARGRPVSADVLPGRDDHLATWAALLRSGLESAFAAGRRAAGGGEQPGDAADLSEAVDEAAGAILLPLRERLSAAIDEAADVGADTTALIAERIGARYREWRNHSLEPLVVESLEAAWARGVYAATADGALLQWISSESGRCADCDDNALEPTVKGQPFPTGQRHPPAHPGCRCLLAPAAVLAAPAS